MDNKKKMQKRVMIILIIIGILLVAGGTYALIYEMFNGTNTNTIRTGTIRFVYNEPSSNVSINNIGLTDNEAMTSSDYFEFDVQATATGKTEIGYFIYLTFDEDNTIPNEAIKVGLTSITGTGMNISDETLLIKEYASNLTLLDNTIFHDIGSTNDYFLYSKTFNFMTSQVPQTDYYRLRLWYDKNYFSNNSITNNEGVHEITTTNGTFKAKINVYGKDGEITNNIDIPTITSFTHLGSGVINVIANDKGGLDSICINTHATDVTGCSWKTYTTGTYETTITEEGTYYAHVKNTVDNIRHSNGLEFVFIPTNFTYDSTTNAYIKTFNYTGGAQELEILQTGYYQIELWGAQGGQSNYGGTINAGGKGGYSSGAIYLNHDEILYLQVGGSGSASFANTSTYSITNNGFGYNGGASANYAVKNSTYGGGGGATDIRCFIDETGRCISNTDNLATNDPLGLNSRIIVAAGGGGGASHTSTPHYSGIGGVGGGISGSAGITNSGYYYGGTSTGGSQIAGGICVSNTYSCPASIDIGGFGSGGGTANTISNVYCGGGGGYYGGGYGYYAPGGGGSSYISGYQGCVAIIEQQTPGGTRTPRNGSDTTTQCTATSASSDVECSKHYSGKVFITSTTEMKAGNELMPTWNKTSTMTGNTGNGYARITWIGTTLP